MIATTEQLAQTLGLTTACDVLQVPRSSVYRARQPKPAPRPQLEPVRALSETEREGDFTISKLVYHVTATPSRNVLQKCAGNIQTGRHPILLVPREQEYRARVLAQEEGIDRKLTIVSIEEFVALNIIELAIEESTDFFNVLKEIVAIYNRRLAEVETDLSLQIEVH